MKKAILATIAIAFGVLALCYIVVAGPLMLVRVGLSVPNQLVAQRIITFVVLASLVALPFGVAYFATVACKESPCANPRGSRVGRSANRLGLGFVQLSNLVVPISISMGQTPILLWMSFAHQARWARGVPLGNCHCELDILDALPTMGLGQSSLEALRHHVLDCLGAILPWGVVVWWFCVQ